MSDEESPDDLEPYITSRDTSPAPRRRETQIQLARRVHAAELEIHGHPQPLVTDEQIDELVKRISKEVVAAVLESVHKDSRKIVREHLGEAFKDMAFINKIPV